MHNSVAALCTLVNYCNKVVLCVVNILMLLNKIVVTVLYNTNCICLVVAM